MKHQPNPEFDAIAGELVQDILDPVVVGMLQSAHEAEVALNYRRGLVNASQKHDVVAALNEELRERGLYQADIYLSGRVRVMGDIDDELRDTEVAIPELIALGEKCHDGQESYYVVSRYPVKAGDFEVVSTSETFPDGKVRMTHRIYQKFMTSTSDGYGESWLYCYPNDIDMYEPLEPSVEKMIRDLTECYPDIAAQLGSLPENCDDDEVLLGALDDLALTVDWSHHPSLTEEERDFVIECAVQYITDKLQFDSDLYVFNVQGPIYSLSANNVVLTRALFEPTELRGAIGHIRLVGNSAEGDSITYLPEIELMASVGRRGGGSNLIYLPVTSIIGLKNLRNIQLFDATVEAEFTTTESLLEYPNELASREWQDQDQQNDKHDTLAIRKAELTALQKRFADLFETCQRAGEQRYESAAEAEIAAQGLSEYIETFMHLMPTEPVILELAGDGVLYVPLHREISFDEKDNNALVIRYPSSELMQAGIFARQGNLTSYRIYFERAEGDGAEEEEVAVGQLKAVLVLHDIEGEEPIQLGRSELLDQQFYTLHSQRSFAAEVQGHITKVSIPELEKMKEIEHRIDEIGELFPDLDRLPDQLNQLWQFFDKAKHNHKFIPIHDVSLLNEIGESVGGDEVGGRVVTKALESITVGRQMRVAGTMYGEDGESLEEDEVFGVVTDVVTTTDQFTTSEPMLKLIIEDVGVAYVPLSSIESMSA